MEWILLNFKRRARVAKDRRRLPHPLTIGYLSRDHRQFHDWVDFPDGKAAIVFASVGARVPAGVTNVVKGSSTWPEARGQMSDVREAR
jgi:hypothetical protein